MAGQMWCGGNQTKPCGEMRRMTGASKLYKDKKETDFQCSIFPRTKSLCPACEVKIAISLQTLQEAAATWTPIVAVP